MNTTKEEGISSEAIIISQTRVWLFGDSIDGIVIMFPIYLFGTVMNSFQVCMYVSLFLQEIGI